MSEAEIHNRPEAPRGYFLTLVTATAAASVGGFAFWASQNMKIGQPLWWQAGSLATVLLATKLTIAATKQRGRMRSAAEGPQRSLLDAFNAKLDAAAAALSRMPESEGGGTFETTAKTETPAPHRIESERERLTKAGFSKAEISQILIARESGATQGMSGGGHGVLSGVLSNLAAVMTHARNFLPSLVVDLAGMLNRRLPPIQRMEAALTLVAKCVVIGVLAYIVSIEFTQLKALSDKAKAEACIERQKNAINFSTMNELMSGNGPDRDLNKDCRNL